MYVFYNSGEQFDIKGIMNFKEKCQGCRGGGIYTPFPTGFLLEFPY